MEGYDQYKVCIEACLKCAAICNFCASSCAKEPDAHMMARCIQLDMECAAICFAAAELMSLGSEKMKDICKICATICDECAEECNKHKNVHCQECAAACINCADQCEIVMN